MGPKNQIIKNPIESLLQKGHPEQVAQDHILLTVSKEGDSTMHLKDLIVQEEEGREWLGTAGSGVYDRLV